MKLFILTLITLASVSAHASEYERRNAIKEEAMQERIRIGRERARAEAEVAYIETIAASLCLPASALQGRYGDWTTTDGSIACGIADGGFGGPYVRCLDASGADVGGYYVQGGKTVLRGKCTRAAKAAKPVRAKRKR